MSSDAAIKLISAYMGLRSDYIRMYTNLLRKTGNASNVIILTIRRGHLLRIQLLQAVSSAIMMRMGLKNKPEECIHQISLQSKLLNSGKPAD